MSRTAIDTDTNGELPPPGDDRAFLGHPRGLLSLSGPTLGPVRYVAGRRHLAGRTHSAEFALAPEAMRRAIRRMVVGAAATALVATAPALAGRLTTDRFGGLLTAPRLRRTMHPVH